MFYKIICLGFLYFNFVRTFKRLLHNWIYNFSSACICQKISVPFPSHPASLSCSSLLSRSAVQLMLRALYPSIWGSCVLETIFSNLFSLFAGAHALTSLLKNDAWQIGTESLLFENIIIPRHEIKYRILA